MSTRIGILTGGGDCPGLNGVLRAVTLYARHTLGWEVVGIRNGFEGLYEESYLDLQVQTVHHLLGRGGTIGAFKSRESASSGWRRSHTPAGAVLPAPFASVSSPRPLHAATMKPRTTTHERSLIRRPPGIRARR